jgi:DNA polymerase III subunit beta
MKFVVSSSALYSHLSAISRVINSKNALPILECFLFKLDDNILSITASDSGTTLVTTVAADGNKQNGSFAIVAKSIMDALKELSEQPLTFEISLETLEIKISYQNGQYSMIGQNADEYPTVIPLGESTNNLTLTAETLNDGIGTTLFAAADDELRPVMNGIYFDITTENVTFVASDGHKLVRNRSLSSKGKTNGWFILPKKPASLLKTLLPKETGNVEISFDEKNAVIKLSEYTLSCRLIEGRYPNYNSVIPEKNPHKVIVDRQSMASALRRVSVFSSQSSNLIKLDISTNQLTVSAQDIDFSTAAEETLICAYTEKPMSIGFKSTYLVEILSNISSDNVQIELNDPSRAGVVVPIEQDEDNDLLMLLMPMMLND